MMYKTLFAIAGLIVPALIFTPQATADVTLSGSTAFNSAADGSWNQAGITATGSCCQVITIEDTAFNDGGSPATLPLALSLGINTLFLESPDWTSAFGVSTGGVDLFFGGSSTPGIAAFTTPVFDQTAVTTFSMTATGNVTAGLDDATTPAPGALSYDNGIDTVALTGLQWVGGTGANPYDASLTVQKVTLLVTADSSGTPTATPEPASLLLVGAGFSAFAIFLRRR